MKPVISTTPNGPILEEGQIATVEVLRQEWVRPRQQDFEPSDSAFYVSVPKPQYIWILTNHSYLVLAQVEKHTYPDRVEFKRTLVEVQELNEAS